MLRMIWLSIALRLMSHGADVTVCDNYAIKNASFYGHDKVVKLLIEHGADVTADNNYAIRKASRNGHHKVVELLKAHGATL